MRPLHHRCARFAVPTRAERVTAALGHLVDQRVLAARRGKIIIRDFDALHRRADGAPSARSGL